MKIKLGSNIADARGKLNGHVFSKNRYGNYVRNKVTPVNPSTAYQTAVRNRLASVSSAWAAQSAADRAAWNAAVSNWGRTNIFGDLINPSGKTLFVKLNTELLGVGAEIIPQPPIPAEVPTMATYSLAAAAGAGTLTLTYTPAIPAAFRVKVYATPGVSAGVSFVKSEYRLIKIAAAADASPLALKVPYEARFGSIPAEGQKIFVKLVFVNYSTGQAGIALTMSCIVAA